MASTSECHIEPAALLLLPPAALLCWGAVPAFAGAAVLAVERGTPARVDRRTAAVFAREAALRAASHALRPVAALTSSRPRGPGRLVAPVLLLAAPPLHHLSLAPLAAFLRHRGAHVWPVGLARAASVDAMAQEIAARVERLARATGSERVDLVAHGIAGLGAAWMARHLDEADRVRRLVTLGTPWRGTRMAVFQRGPLASSLLPGAPALDPLSPPAAPTVAIWSTDDPWVIPTPSALPDGAESVQLEGAGHVDLLASARAFRAVLQALAERPAAA